MSASAKSLKIISVPAMRKLKTEYVYTFAGIEVYKCYDLNDAECGFVGRVTRTKYGPLCPNMDIAHMRALRIRDALIKNR